MELMVATEYLSEHMTALKAFFYQLVTVGLRLIAEVLTLVANCRPRLGTHDFMRLTSVEE
jgi:hypothetical protein